MSTAAPQVPLLGIAQVLTVLHCIKAFILFCIELHQVPFSLGLSKCPVALHLMQRLPYYGGGIQYFVLTGLYCSRWQNH